MAAMDFDRIFGFGGNDYLYGEGAARRLRMHLGSPACGWLTFRPIGSGDGRDLLNQIYKAPSELAVSDICKCFGQS